MKIRQTNKHDVMVKNQEFEKEQARLPDHNMKAAILECGSKWNGNLKKEYKNALIEYKY